MARYGRQHHRSDGTRGRPAGFQAFAPLGRSRAMTGSARQSPARQQQAPSLEVSARPCRRRSRARLGRPEGLVGKESWPKRLATARTCQPENDCAPRAMSGVHSFWYEGCQGVQGLQGATQLPPSVPRVWCPSGPCTGRPCRRPGPPSDRSSPTYRALSACSRTAPCCVILSAMLSPIGKAQVSPKASNGGSRCTKVRSLHLSECS